MSPIVSKATAIATTPIKANASKLNFGKTKLTVPKSVNVPKFHVTVANETPNIKASGSV